MTKTPCVPHSLLLLSAFGSAALRLATPGAAILEEPAADDVPPAAAHCVGGTVWHGPSAACVDAAPGLVPDEVLYAALRTHAHAGRYAEALLAMLEVGTPRVLTAEGFILRLTGWAGEGLALYAEALSLDPEYHLARAYPSLWQLEQDDRAGAVWQFSEIEAHGGRGSAAWRMLADALEGAPDGD